MTLLWLIFKTFLTEHVGDWYEIMNNRRISLAFSENKPDVYEKYVNWLGHFMDFFTTIKLHPSQKDNALKPTQKGVFLTTTSILMLQKELLQSGYEFVLTARFTNDCIGKKLSFIKFFKKWSEC